jgi:tetratricopeptide (TPR) repeat protein
MLQTYKFARWCLIFLLWQPMLSIADDVIEAKKQMQQALQFEKQGKTKEAMANYDLVIERFAHSLGASDNWRFSHPYAVNFLYKAELLSKLKQPEKAMDTYNTVIKRFKNADDLALIESVTDAVLGNAELLAGLGKIVEARTAFKQVVERVGTSIAVIDVHRLVKAQKYLAIPEVDTWSGTYRIEAGSPDNAQPIKSDIYEISKLPDLLDKDVTPRYSSDLARWRISSKSEAEKDSIVIRRFLWNDDLDEYKGFGWKALYLQNKIECMDAKHFFFCRTKPNTKVTFNDKESYVTKSGTFGILLHVGVFEMIKLSE